MDKEYNAESAVQAKVYAYGGNIVWNFTQCHPFYRNQIGAGICLALSSYYILAKTTGQNLSSLIGGGSNGHGMKPNAVNEVHLGFIAQRQAQFRNLNTPELKAWLKNSKLWQAGYCLPQNGHTLKKITDSFKYVTKGHALVRLYAFNGGLGGHAIVVTPGDGKPGSRASMYDPNFGEFTFPNSTSMYNFLRYLFYDFYFSQLGFSNFEFRHLIRKA